MKVDVVACSRMHHSGVLGIAIVFLCRFLQQAIAEAITEDVVEFPGDSLLTTTLAWW
jgi:hypothetical protein